MEKSHDNASNNLTLGEASDLDRANRQEVFTPHSSAVFFQRDAAEFLFLHPPVNSKDSYVVLRAADGAVAPWDACGPLQSASGRERPSDTPAFPASQREPGAARLADSCSQAIAAFFFFPAPIALCKVSRMKGITSVGLRFGNK